MSGLKWIVVVVAAALSGCATVEVATPYWAELAPTAGDFRHTYPSEALSRQITGRASLLCGVRADRSLDCVVTSATPAGMGFEDAALSHKFRVRREYADKMAHFILPVQWATD